MSKSISLVRSLVICFAAALFLTPLVAYSQTALGTLDNPAKTVTRDNGEMRVYLGEIWQASKDTFYPLSVSFLDAEHHERFMRGENQEVALEDFTALVLRTEAGVVTLAGAELNAATLHNLPNRSAGALCGDIIARGMVEYRPGEFYLVNFHRDISFSNNAIPGDGDIWPCQTTTCAVDVFDECDDFAIGGCGGPTCVNLCRDRDCNFQITNAQCAEYIVPFGLDLCICI